MTHVTPDGEVLTSPLADTIIGTVPPFFKTPWNHNTNDESNRVALTCTDETRTQQHLAAETDINNILAKFMAGGDLPITGQPNYVHIADGADDLQDNMVTRWEVDQAWEALPKAAQNILRTPEQFCDYVEHCMATGDLDPLRELGLAKPKQPPESLPDPPNAPQGDTPAPKAPKADTAPADPPK